MTTPVSPPDNQSPCDQCGATSRRCTTQGDATLCPSCVLDAIAQLADELQLSAVIYRGEPIELPCDVCTVRPATHYVTMTGHNPHVSCPDCLQESAR